MIMISIGSSQFQYLILSINFHRPKQKIKEGDIIRTWYFSNTILLQFSFFCKDFIFPNKTFNRVSVRQNFCLKCFYLFSITYLGKICRLDLY